MAMVLSKAVDTVERRRQPLRGVYPAAGDPVDARRRQLQELQEGMVERSEQWAFDKREIDQTWSDAPSAARPVPKTKKVRLRVSGDFLRQFMNAKLENQHLRQSIRLLQQEHKELRRQLAAATESHSDEAAVQLIAPPADRVSSIRVNIVSESIAVPMRDDRDW